MPIARAAVGLRGCYVGYGRHLSVAPRKTKKNSSKRQNNCALLSELEFLYITLGVFRNISEGSRGCNDFSEKGIFKVKLFFSGVYRHHAKTACLASGNLPSSAAEILNLWYLQRMKMLLR